jgi:hypothetical protein
MNHIMNIPMYTLYALYAFVCVCVSACGYVHALYMHVDCITNIPAYMSGHKLAHKQTLSHVLYVHTHMHNVGR